MVDRSKLWLGLSPPSANTGLPLRDNGICLAGDEEIILAVSEERLSRKKHDPNIQLSLASALNLTRSVGQPIVRTIYSTCSDSAWTPKVLPAKVGRVSPAPSHHYSHALSAFMGSPYHESLVIVADAGGNTLRANDSATWWACPREQTTAWYGIRGNVHLLERYQHAPYDIGFGEWYRAFTHFLGWPSHTLSGNTMALSAFGDDRELPAGIWDDDISGTFRGSVRNDPHQPIHMVSLLLARVGLVGIEPRQAHERLMPGHALAASFIQRSLESQFERLTDDLVKKYEQPNICLSGGVAQNCVMAAKLAQRFGPQRVFVSAYSGDVGQCVGNALFGRMLDLGPDAPPLPENVFLGQPYNTRSIEDALSRWRIVAHPVDNAVIIREAAQRVAAGQVVAVFHGRSEFGPRALGHRSVICDPLNEEAVLRVKRHVKHRDEFMPLAPVVGGTLLQQLGDLPVSETMTFAPRLPASLRDEFGTAVHVDGTSRIQKATIGFFSDLITELESRTGRRVLINTSFNQRGEPIVESPLDALRATQRLAIDCLILEDRLVLKEMFN